MIDYDELAKREKERLAMEIARAEAEAASQLRREVVASEDATEHDKRVAREHAALMFIRAGSLYQRYVKSIAAAEPAPVVEAQPALAEPAPDLEAENAALRARIAELEANEHKFPASLDEKLSDYQTADTVVPASVSDPLAAFKLQPGFGETLPAFTARLRARLNVLGNNRQSGIGDMGMVDAEMNIITEVLGQLISLTPKVGG